MLGGLLAAAAVASPLLPAPKQARYEQGRLALRDGLRIVVGATAPRRVGEIAEILRDGLRETAGVTAVIGMAGSRATPGDMVLALAPDAAANPEAYTLKVGSGVEITAADPRGLLWGVQTLLQSVEGAEGDEPSA